MNSSTQAVIFPQSSYHSCCCATSCVICDSVFRLFMMQHKQNRTSVLSSSVCQLIVVLSLISSGGQDVIFQIEGDGCVYHFARF